MDQAENFSATLIDVWICICMFNIQVWSISVFYNRNISYCRKRNVLKYHISCWQENFTFLFFKFNFSCYKKTLKWVGNLWRSLLFLLFSHQNRILSASNFCLSHTTKMITERNLIKIVELMLNNFLFNYCCFTYFGLCVYHF